MNGSPKIRERVFNILDQIAAEAVDDELIRQSVRMVKRAGVPMHKTYLERYQSDTELGKNDSQQRQEEATKRKEWERQYQQQAESQQQNQQGVGTITTSSVGNGIANNINNNDDAGKSALSRRMAGGKPDPFMSSVLDPDSIATIAKDKNDLQNEMNNNNNNSNDDEEATTISAQLENSYAQVSEMIARAGSGDAFQGQTLGIGGLDDVLVEIKRRIWTPLAAPPKLLNGTYLW
jgi:hypothetical protein